MDRIKTHAQCTYNLTNPYAQKYNSIQVLNTIRIQIKVWYHDTCVLASNLKYTLLKKQFALFALLISIQRLKCINICLFSLRNGCIGTYPRIWQMRVCFQCPALCVRWICVHEVKSVYPSQVCLSELFGPSPSRLLLATQQTRRSERAMVGNFICDLIGSFLHQSTKVDPLYADKGQAFYIKLSLVCLIIYPWAVASH